jgi:hypothetical protein
VIGHLMLVPEAMQDGLVAASNAVRGPIMPLGNRVSPTGSFMDPEYAQVGLTEANARRTQDVVSAVVRFDSTTRTIIDGHKVGFCKLIADRKTSKILGCHVVGQRAVDIVQVAAIAIAGGMRVEDLARVPLSFPTYAGILVNAAADAARQLGLTVLWQTLEGGTVIASRVTRPSGRPSYRGECRPGGGAPVKTEDQAYALGYATGTTLPSPNPRRDALPVAWDEERPLPNARRPISNQRE